MKYIILEKGGLELFFIFSELSTHKEVALKLEGKVVGAGFCHADHTGRFHCYGESVSLGIKSRNLVDAQILNFGYQ